MPAFVATKTGKAVNGQREDKPTEQRLAKGVNE